jgi:hypothetical protein
MKGKLLKDIYSYGKKIKDKQKIYGKQDEIVTIISDHHNMLIVQGKEKFGVNKSFIEILE